MSNNPSNISASLDRKELEQTLAYVEQMIRDFESMTAQTRTANVEISGLDQQFEHAANARSTNPEGVPSGGDFRELDQSLARQKALRQELTDAASAYTQELVQWAREIERRSPENQAEKTVGGDNFAPIAASTSINEGNPQIAAGAMDTAGQRDAVAEEMMRIDPPTASDPITDSFTLLSLAGIGDLVEGVGSLAVAAGKEAADAASGLVVVGFRKVADLASDALSGLTKGTASEIAPGGGLQASEDLGGHLLKKHVGKTETELFLRALTDKITRGVASSFFDRAAAEAAASQATNANSAKISAWLASNSPRLEITGKMVGNVGRTVTHEGVSVLTTASRFVLIRDTASALGYYIYTGYPY